MINLILELFKTADVKGLTRAELAQELFGTNEQHRVCSQVLALIKQGELKEHDTLRRRNPNGSGTGRVIVINKEVIFG